MCVYPSLSSVPAETLCGNTGVLQPLGDLLPGDPEQAHVDRRLGAHALHPLRSGVLLLLRTQERSHTHHLLRIRMVVA
jgi:hypothetical protein